MRIKIVIFKVKINFGQIKRLKNPFYLLKKHFNMNI